jgi:multiple sugar transport system ATP-binding protein
VTHDQVEAMTMGDRVAVMKDGVLQQCDTPLNLYDSPRNLFVAGFIGSPAMNLMEGDVAEDGIHIGDYVVGVPREVLAKAPNEKRLVLGIRPENFALGSGTSGIGIDVAVVEELGADAFVYGTVAGLADEDKLTAQQITARISSRTPPERGSTIRLEIDPEHVHVFSQADGRRLSESYAR